MDKKEKREAAQRRAAAAMRDAEAVDVSKATAGPVVCR